MLYEIYGGQISIGAGFLGVLQFPLPILIPPTVPHSSSLIRGQLMADVSSGHNLTPQQETKREK
jgi:hypothetical protein